MFVTTVGDNMFLIRPSRRLATRGSAPAPALFAMRLGAAPSGATLTRNLLPPGLLLPLPLLRSVLGSLSVPLRFLRRSGVATMQGWRHLSTLVATVVYTQPHRAQFTYSNCNCAFQIAVIHYLNVMVLNSPGNSQ
eukprot:251444-Pyramimonas_sp.AAC.1